MTKKLKAKVSPKELTIDEMLEIAAQREKGNQQVEETIEEDETK
jgi:hypothetical protein